MSIRVQCGSCGSVMNVREDYAGTERRCPKCTGKFRVPTLEEAAAKAASDAKAAASADDDFDPVAFLTGEKRNEPKSPAASQPKESGSKQAADDFDPLDVLSGESSRGVAAKKADASGAKADPAASKTAPAPAGDFDPLDVLGSGPSQPGSSTTQAPPKDAPPGPKDAPAAESPTPHRPSWAKPPPEPEKNDWDDTADEAQAALKAPQPKRPSWAKAPPEPEKNDWDEPTSDSSTVDATADAAPPQPKRPSWAKPLPGEEPQTAKEEVANDASPAAQAAATAVSADNPALQDEEPREARFTRAAFVAWLKRRTILMVKTIVAAAVLFGISWRFTGPVTPTFEVIGSTRNLTLVPVAGRITVDDKPVAEARVMFHPRGTRFRSPEGVTDSDGKFQLRFCEGYDGAPPGPYRVQLQLISNDGSDEGVRADNLLREQTFVVPDEGGTIEIALSTKQKKQ